MWANGPGSGIKAGNPQPLGEGEAALCATYSLLWKCEPGTRARAGFPVVGDTRPLAECFPGPAGSSLSVHSLQPTCQEPLKGMGGAVRSTA